MIAMDKLLEPCVDKNVSDLHLSVGSPPVVRLHGRLKPLTAPALTAEPVGNRCARSSRP